MKNFSIFLLTLIAFSNVCLEANTKKQVEETPTKKVVAKKPNQIKLGIKPKIAQDPDGSPYLPQVVIDASGNAVALWEVVGGDAQFLKTSSASFGGTWDSPQVLSDPGFILFHPSLSMNANGDAVAIWIENNSEFQVLTAATRPSGGSWSAPFHLQKKPVFANGNTFTYSMTINKQNQIVVVWGLSPEYKGGDAIFSSTFDPSQKTWSPPQQID